jgi:hypothetical protein
MPLFAVTGFILFFTPKASACIATGAQAGE